MPERPNSVRRHEAQPSGRQPTGVGGLHKGTFTGQENGVPIPRATNHQRTITIEELSAVRSPKLLFELLQAKEADVDKIKSVLGYETELEKVQIELVKMQRWVQENRKRVAILFEGRDAAGKGGTIRRFTEHLNPRAMRVVALPVPTEEEKGQWYFQRYIRQLPNLEKSSFLIVVGTTALSSSR